MTLLAGVSALMYGSLRVTSGPLKNIEELNPNPEYLVTQFWQLLWSDELWGISVIGMSEMIEEGYDVGKLIILCMNVNAFFRIIPCTVSILYFEKLDLVLVGRFPLL